MSNYYYIEIILTVDVRIDNNCAFKYKDTYMHYSYAKGYYAVHSNIDKKKQDTLRVFFEGAENWHKAWERAIEFLRAWSFANNMTVWFILGHTFPILVCQVPNDSFKYPSTISNIKNELFEKVAVPKATDYFSIQQQYELMRLFCVAFNDTNIYSRILFFWHVLTFSSQKPEANDKFANDKMAAKYVNDNYEKITLKLSDSNIPDRHLKDCLNERILMREEDQNIKIGEYIKTNVRNAIAHIPRHTNKPDIIIDDLRQMRHLAAIAWLLEKTARIRLENECALNVNPGTDTVTIYDEKEWPLKTYIGIS